MPPHHPTTVYLSAPDMVRLVRRKGLTACIAGVAERTISTRARGWLAIRRWA